MRNAMNEVLRDWYVGDCAGGVERWNRILEHAGVSDRLRLPDRKFNRHIGMYSGFHFDPNGVALSAGGVGRPTPAGAPSPPGTEKMLRGETARSVPPRQAGQPTPRAPSGLS